VADAHPLWRVLESFGLHDVHPASRSPAAAAAGEPAAGAGVLDELRAEVERCTRCRLAEGRNSVVFGEGSPGSGVLFVGEGPGASEDETGRPFVGKAGQLLDRILESIGLDRTRCYIANVVKCRPPNNRPPSPDEIEACSGHLDRQIEALCPGVVVALGSTAATRLLGSRSSVGQLRGTVHRTDGTPVVVTYHPAALLRTPALKRPVWEDMKALRRLMDERGLPRGGSDGGPGIRPAAKH
jgi:DNA polymerase